MKLVQRANKQLRVPDDRLADMLAAGYVEINPKTGKPVKLEKPAAKNANARKPLINGLRDARG